MAEGALVRFENVDGIGVITIDNPPVNALSPGVPEGIVENVERGNADPSIKAMVLIGAGRSFIAGADIRQFGTRRPPPVPGRRTHEVLDASAKPVVAAIHGYALGGGLEIALAANYRIAVPSAKVGLPEVLIGILPGSGGTQRLPRLIGPKAAMEMIMSGRHVPAEEAKQLGIIDELVPEGSDLRPRRSRWRAVLPTPGRCRASATVTTNWPKPRPTRASSRRCANRSLAARVTRRRPTIASPQSRPPARCRLIRRPARARALRRARKFGRGAGAALCVLCRARGRQIARHSARDAAAGDRNRRYRRRGYDGRRHCDELCRVRLSREAPEVSQEALDRGLARIRTNYETSVKRGSLTEAEMDRRLKLIEPVKSFDDIAQCDVVIEAVFERIPVKEEVFKKLDEVMKPGALLYTNTSGIDIDIMANATKRPQDVAGTHFFAPANVMKLFEVVKGAKSAPDTLATGMALGRRIGKISAMAGNGDGFVANRSRTPFGTEMNIMVEEGALPEQVDKVMVDFGYPIGPFATADLSGLDIGYDSRQRRAAENPNYRKMPIADMIVEAGRLGQKTGAGWFRYEKGDRTPHPDPELARMIKDKTKELGIPQKNFSDEEILRRLLFASVNEACKILEEGKAYRASDIDVMWLNGFGFPRYRGGLMYWADGIGVAEVYRQIQAWHQQYGERWAPAPLLRSLAETGTPLREAKPGRPM